MYTVKEIRLLGGQVLERVRLALRGYILENRGTGDDYSFQAISVSGANSTMLPTMP
ncbi:MAG: hypothetical protein WAZ77_18750 [Candidatus Nitrosopolaris sp.]|jgi:hypothetical protein